MTTSARPRIVAAMSGGVDSSVTAALLAARGLRRRGRDAAALRSGAAPPSEGRLLRRAGHPRRAPRRRDSSASRTTSSTTKSASSERVIADFADTYARGETPIPCVRCNERVKFADLMDTARELGADALATGHYVRRVDGRERRGAASRRRSGRDQSYFLFATTQAQLDYLRFPLGDMAKPEVRAHRGRARPDRRRQAGQPGHLLRAGRQIREHRASSLKPDAATPGEIVDSTARCSAATTA